MLLKVTLNLGFRRLEYRAFQAEVRFQAEQAGLLGRQGLCRHRGRQDW